MATTRGRWEVNVGDEVWVSSGSRSWGLYPVEKIGSKLVHIGARGIKPIPFYLETGQRRDGYPGSFMTQAHRNEELRRDFLITSLRDDYGIEVAPRRRSLWTTEGLELLAEAVFKIANSKHEPTDREATSDS